jgi:hypothetical protein
MSCINVNIECKNECLSVAATSIGEKLKALVTAAPCINAIVTIPETINCKVTNAVQDFLKIRCSIVCSLAEIADYLEVTPEEIQWITDDMGVFYDVQSNVEWIVVTS